MFQITGKSIYKHLLLSLFFLGFSLIFLPKVADAQPPVEEQPIDPNQLKNASPSQLEQLQKYLQDKNQPQQNPGADVHRPPIQNKTIAKDSTLKDDFRKRIRSIDDTYGIFPPFGSSPLTSVSGSKNNPNLLPERTKSYEFGLEAAFLKNRLGFDITYYDAKTFDQIFAVPVSTATGYNSKFFNAGDVRNKGVELSVFGTPVQTSNFSWNINLNWTRNRNKVEALTAGIDAIQLASFQGGVSIMAALGKPYGMIRGTDFVYTNGQHTINQTNGRPLRTSS
ncbi:MAG: TonB-dependent receptor domain-containing protein, partial [Flavisolibacter sp.]